MKKSEFYREENKDKIISKIRRKISCSRENALFIYNCFQNTRDIEKIELSDDNLLIHNLEHDITNSILNSKILDVLSTMPNREAEVLLMRFGINHDKDHTLDEVGNSYGVTRERIRQIEARALRRIRHPRRARVLAKFLPDPETKELSDEALPKGEKFID
jgi:RNA polymerase sigma factor (sigma-70 family)